MIDPETKYGLDLRIDEPLKQKGILRELLRLIQGLRKEAGLMPSDKIKLYLELPQVLAFLKTKSEEIIKSTFSIFNFSAV